MIRRLLLTLGGLTLLAAFTAAPAYARPAPATSPLPASGSQRTSIPEICAQGGTGYCLNNWGGLVKMEKAGYTNDDFGWYTLTHYCDGGYVTNGVQLPGPACPFPVGSGLNSEYNGDQIVRIVSGVSNGCIGTDFSENANVGTCPPSSGGTGSNIWIIGPACYVGSGAGSYYINVYWSGQHGNSGASSLESGGSIGAQAYVAGNNPAASCWQAQVP
jgi:hypothetical protein